MTPLLAWTLTFANPALANGQTTHLWISETAVSHLPEGDLADLLATENEALRVGTMFPDGGYAVGHDYGEIAHWEPFQGLFRDWILDQFDSPSNPDAAPYVAFYLGMASHGMADQVFDSMYMERSRVYDAEYGWASEVDSLDTSQDIVFGSLTGGQRVSDFALPAILPTLFSSMDIDVDMDTMESGQSWLEVAVAGVETTSLDPDIVREHLDTFPWGCSHLLDETVPGAPPMEAEIVARYWQTLWDELNGNAQPLEIIGRFPPDGAMGHRTEFDDVEARLSIVFNKSLYESVVMPTVFHVESDGQELPISLDLFYWSDSHVVNISPTEGWMPDAMHRLRIDRELVSVDGSELRADFVSNFSTALESTDEESARCGCRSSASSRFDALWMLVFPWICMGRRHG